MTHVLSFDFGTGGVRAGVYDVERQVMVATAESPYATDFPRAGWAEQRPNDWWTALLAAGRSAVEKSGSANIASICVATTASTVAICDKAGNPIRPAILWMDCRAFEEARATEAISHPVMAYSGGGDAVEWLVPKAMWLSRNEPDTYHKADIICEAIDFINYHLTGVWVGSRMNAACKWNYDSKEAQFVPSIYEALGVPDLIDKLPQRIIAVGDGIAPLKRDVAAALGIESSAIVAQGGIDAHVGILGAGTVDVGGMLIIGGTSVVHLTQLAGVGDVSGFWGPYPNALVDDLWLVEAGQVSAGSILQWLSERIFGLDAAGHALLIEEAMAVPARGSGLLTLDYWMGNRTPYRDGNLRGAMMGLSLGHGRADIYASAVDSIALGTANVLAVLEERGVVLDKIVMAGGICKNRLWLQATIDAIGRPVHVASEENLSLIGAAISSAHALGLFPSLIAASQAMAISAKPTAPNPSRSRWYAERLPMYRQATAVLTPTFHALSRQQAEGHAA